MGKSAVMLLSSLARKELVEAYQRGESIKDLAARYSLGRDALSRFFNRKRFRLQIDVLSTDREFVRIMTELIEIVRESQKIKIRLE